MVRIGLVGDHDESITAHRAIPRAIELASRAHGLNAAGEWIDTDAITDDSRPAALDAIWVVPGSPYRNMDGALRAITFARAFIGAASAWI